MVSFGSLGIGLGAGTLAEYTRRALGLKQQSIGDAIDSMFLTKTNVERIVSTLCKVRGKIHIICNTFIYIFCGLIRKQLVLFFNEDNCIVISFLKI